MQAFAIARIQERRERKERLSCNDLKRQEKDDPYFKKLGISIVDVGTKKKARRSMFGGRSRDAPSRKNSMTTSEKADSIAASRVEAATPVDQDLQSLDMTFAPKLKRSPKKKQRSPRARSQDSPVSKDLLAKVMRCCANNLELEPSSIKLDQQIKPINLIGQF